MTGFLTTADSFVADVCRGLAVAHPQLMVNGDPLYLYRRDGLSDRVALVSGGGSGHEPLHGGFVGTGMLAAACPGLVFTSPTVDQIVAAAECVAGSAGVLFVVKNYTGDVLAFEAAAEVLSDRGVQTASVVVHDDVATDDTDDGPGRRGVAGTLVVEKILGAACAAGLRLDELIALGNRVSRRLRSMGVALSSCHVPGRALPLFDLPVGQMEVGIGIHGEPGRRRVDIADAPTIVNELLGAILREWAHDGGEVLLITNGFGATPLGELYLLHRLGTHALADRGYHVTRHLVGNYVTSLDMKGMSFTLSGLDEQAASYWDAPVSTPALNWGSTGG